MSSGVMESFVYEALASRVVFGPGTFSRIGAEAEQLALSRVLVLSTPRQRLLAEQAAEFLGERCIGIHDQAAMHVPLEAAEAALTEAEKLGADACLAVGGGSTIGLGKAVALKSGLPILVVATTYSGSEMTPIWGLTENGVKTTGRDPRVLPKTVIYDPRLTVDLPVRISVTSGMNAIAHAVEALYAEQANPVVSMMAEAGIQALAQSLPDIVSRDDDIDARSQALYGSWLCGACLGSVGMALHHKLCHTLGGSFNLPHADVHSVIIPHATAYNASAAPRAMMRIGRALGADNASLGLYRLEKAIGAPTSLEEIGMQWSDIDRAVEIATKNPYYNPRPVTAAGIRRLLENAFNGEEPRIDEQ